MLWTWAVSLLAEKIQIIIFTIIFIIWISSLGSRKYHDILICTYKLDHVGRNWIMYEGRTCMKEESANCLFD